MMKSAFFQIAHSMDIAVPLPRARTLINDNDHRLCKRKVFLPCGMSGVVCVLEGGERPSPLPGGRFIKNAIFISQNFR